MVVAHHDGPAPDAPHVLFYGHYDVQPVDPIELWENDPFAPAVEGDRARPQGHHRPRLGRRQGPADDLRRGLPRLEGRCTAQLPCRVTILFEGEEESGSPSLKPFLEANADELKADFALVCDTGMWDRETPAICASLRGLVGEEIIVKAADRDLHSGIYGGAAANPIRILAKILADIHDETGRVTIPGFYDGVEETPSQILKSWETLGETAENFLGADRPVDPVRRKGPLGAGTDLGAADRRVQRHHRRLYRQGLQDGDRRGGVGEGLVPPRPQAGSGQDPRGLPANSSRRAFPADCSVEFHPHGGSPAIQLSYDSPFLAKAKNALSDEWPKPAVMIGMRRLDPDRRRFPDYLGMESLLVGFGSRDDRIHSPNEKYELTSFHKGQRSWARILDALSPADSCARSNRDEQYDIRFHKTRPARPRSTTMSMRSPSTPRRWG